jgi:acetylornithine/N-succinyldiaminopimelate aminotransferase
MAVLEIIGQDAFLAEVTRKGALFAQGLQSLVARHPTIFESVRGIGLLMGLKCAVPNTDVVKAAYGQNLLTVPAADNVLRLLPALNIEDADIAQALDRLDRAATALSSF